MLHVYDELFGGCIFPIILGHRCMGDFFLGASQINFKPESKARPNFFLDFLPFFFVKLIKIAFV